MCSCHPPKGSEVKRFVKRSALRLVLLLPAMLLHGLVAAEQPARMTIDLQVRSHGTAQKGRESARWTASEKFHASFAMLTSGVPENTNRLDLGGNAAGVGKSLREAQERTPGRAQQEAVAARGKAALDACKGDLSCMMQVAQDLGNATAAWNARSPEAPGDARFLTYYAPDPERCGGDYSAVIKRDKTGVFPDVQGLVPYMETMTADYHASALEKSSLCGQVAMMVLDTAAEKVYASVFPVMKIRGKRTRQEQQRPVQQSEGEVMLQNELVTWVLEKMRHGLPKSGKERVELKFPADTGWRGEKVFTVDFAWAFDAR